MDINNILTELVKDQLSKSVSQKLNISENKSADVVSMAVPLLIGGLAKNAKNPEEAESITKAVSKDHDGSILNNIASVVLEDSTELDGQKILSHILGNKTTAASKVIEKKTNVDSAQVIKILSLVAPVVLGVIGKKQKDDNLNSTTLSEVLADTARRQVGESSEKSNILTSILDQDSDGNIRNEATNIGLRLLKNFLRRK